MISFDYIFKIYNFFLKLKTYKNNEKFLKLMIKVLIYLFINYLMCYDYYIFNLFKLKNIL